LEGSTMATDTFFFPGNVYPDQYNPPIPGFDYNASPGELMRFGRSTVISEAADSQLIQLANGLVVRLIGTNLIYDSFGRGTGGILTGIQLLQHDGSTLVHEMSGLDRSFAGFYDAKDAYDAWNMNQWLLNGNDSVIGSAGDDALEGGAGNDTM